MLQAEKEKFHSEKPEKLWHKFIVTTKIRNSMVSEE
jgi:hypothetical protein